MQPIPINPIDFLEWIGAIVGSFVAIWKGVLPAYKWCKRKYHARQERQEQLAQTIRLVTEQLNYNGGGSMKDMVRQIANGQNSVMMQLELLKDEARSTKSMMKSVINLSDKMVLMFDSLGHLRFANHKFLEFVGKDRDEVEEMKWISLVHQAEREVVFEEVRAASAQERGFSITVRMHCNGKGIQEVHISGNREEDFGYMATVTHKELV